jgi:hypothetical protein
MMKFATWKRTLLAGLLTLGVAGGTLAPLVAGDAAAGGGYRPGTDTAGLPDPPPKPN